MPSVEFVPEGKRLEFAQGELKYQGEGFRESVLDVALNRGVDLRHACGGICACITCHVIVEEGDDNLSPMEKDEEDRIFRIREYTLHSRLACRAVVRGDVKVRVPAASRSKG